MSAFGIAVSADKTQVILAGDGMTTNNGEIHRLNSSKLQRINDDIAVVWMGIGKASVGEYVAEEAKGMNSVKEVSECVSKWMKKAYDTPENRHISEKIPFWILIIGYDPELTAYKLWTGSDNRYTPQKEEFTAGQLGAKTANRGPDKTSFQRLVATKYWPLYKPNLKHAVKEAFTEMVTTYQNEGEPCGGELYFETLKQ